MISIQQALREGQSNLPASSSSRLDAELLLAAVLGRRREYLHTWPDHHLNEEELDLFRRQVGRRAQGYPVAYLVGRRGFWKFDLKVDASVLIPRPETELLVETCLECLPADQPALVADLGTGSGAIALALAAERPDWRIIATDLSHDALAIARHNAEAARLGNISFREGGWCAPLAERDLDAIVSNPPYIDEGDSHLEQGDVRYEPRLALVSAEQGLADIKAIAGQAGSRLRPGGWLLLEHGFEQGAAVRELLSGLGFVSVETRQDLAGHERITLGQTRVDH